MLFLHPYAQDLPLFLVLLTPFFTTFLYQLVAYEARHFPPDSALQKDSRVQVEVQGSAGGSGSRVAAVPVTVVRTTTLPGSGMYVVTTTGYATSVWSATVLSGV